MSNLGLLCWYNGQLRLVHSFGVYRGDAMAKLGLFVVVQRPIEARLFSIGLSGYYHGQFRLVAVMANLGSLVLV